MRVRINVSSRYRVAYRAKVFFLKEKFAHAQRRVTYFSSLEGIRLKAVFLKPRKYRLLHARNNCRRIVQKENFNR